MLDLPERERNLYSRDACPRCGWHHMLSDFKPQSRHRDGTRVRVMGIPISGPMPMAFSVGIEGVVVEWGQYGGPLWVRVEVPGKEPLHQRRENFYPCSLEVL